MKRLQLCVVFIASECAEFATDWIMEGSFFLKVSFTSSLHHLLNSTRSPNYFRSRSTILNPRNLEIAFRHEFSFYCLWSISKIAMKIARELSIKVLSSCEQWTVENNFSMKLSSHRACNQEKFIHCRSRFLKVNWNWSHKRVHF